MKQSATSSALAIARILLGFIFLWAFFDKLLGLGVSTPAAKAMLVGGSPTFGFLSNNAGPFAEMFNGLAGQIWVDWLFMIGLLGIGSALVLGIGMRIATFTGALLLFLMWLASFPIKNNPFVDDHVIYIFVLFGLNAQKAGETLGFGKAWKKSSLVKQYPILQ